MTRQQIERKYGKTKLDHALSYFCLAFEKILEFMAILFLPLVVVQQIVIYGEHRPEIVLPALSVVMTALIGVGVVLIKRKKQEKK